MKGLLQTSAVLKAILDKEKGLVPPGGRLCHATVLEDPSRGRMMIISDCAVHIAPDLEAKVKIIKSAVALAHKMGMECPKVAVIAPVEVPKSSIPSTMDAKALSEMAWADCIVGGPFALDNAVSLEAAQRKGIDHPVAGAADVLIMPDLCTGNVFIKSLTYFARLDSAGTLCGATVPVILSSRVDTTRNKYCAILTALLL
jgi:phosphate butyryltransferase